MYDVFVVCKYTFKFLLNVLEYLTMYLILTIVQPFLGSYRAAAFKLMLVWINGVMVYHNHK